MVRLALERAGLAHNAARAGAAGDERPEVRRLSIAGRRFACELPTAPQARRARALHREQHLAAARAAAFLGQCIAGGEEGGEDLEEMEVCIGDTVRVFEGVTHHDRSAARALGDGGFLQEYTGVSDEGRRLRVTLRCRCRMPGRLEVREPRCRMGDVITYHGPAHAGIAKLDRALVTSDSLDDDSLEVLWLGRKGEPAHGVVLREDARDAEGVPCGEALDVEPVARVRGVTGDLDAGTLQVGITAVTCCSRRQLQAEAPRGSAGSGSAEFFRLLSPMVGRCQRLVNHWWTYEICWPFRVRQLHIGLNGATESAGALLGSFDRPLDLALRPSTAMTSDAAEYELVATLQGGPCSQTVQSWVVALAADGESGPGKPAVGGAFNPWNVDAVRGALAHDPSNVDGCASYQGRRQGAVVLALRGNCWFHTKALRAQEAGAAAVIVYNDKRPMVEVMDGVDELRSPRIPTVLVDRRVGEALLARLGAEVVLRKSLRDEGVDLRRPISTTVIFECDPEGFQRRAVCQEGDAVDVKLIVGDTENVEAQWPNSAVRVLRATMGKLVHEEGETLVEVMYEPTGMEDDEAELPAVVPLNVTYKDGTLCDVEVSAFLSRAVELQACHFEFAMHVPSLCAHPQLLPRLGQEPQAIECLADDGAEAPVACDAAAATCSAPPPAAASEAAADGR